MMKQDIKNKEFRENHGYVSPSVKVIEVTAQRVLCGSGDFDGSGIDKFTPMPEDTGTWN